MRKIRVLPLIDLPHLDSRTFIALDIPLMIVNKKFISNKAWLFLRDRATKVIENRISVWKSQNKIVNRNSSVNWASDVDTKNEVSSVYFGGPPNDSHLLMLKSLMHSRVFNWSYWGYLKKLLPKASFYLSKTIYSPSLFLEGNQMVGAIMGLRSIPEDAIAWTLCRKYLNE